MKTLILMRHAKSDWNAGNTADHDRSLSDRGRVAAPAMGRWLQDQNLFPDLVLCSTAVRAKETLALVRPYLPQDVPTQLLERLYLALPREMLVVLGKSQDAGLSTILLVGHNPGIGSLAHWLSAQGDPKYLAQMQDKFPTGAVAVIDFDIVSWQELDNEQGRLRAFKTPKQLTKD